VNKSIRLAAPAVAVMAVLALSACEGDEPAADDAGRDSGSSAEPTEQEGAGSEGEGDHGGRAPVITEGWQNDDGDVLVISDADTVSYLQNPKNPGAEMCTGTLGTNENGADFAEMSCVNDTHRYTEATLLPDGDMLNARLPPWKMPSA
jgi:hypothetical protein